MKTLAVLLLLLIQTPAIQAATYDIADTSGTRGATNVDVKVWLRDGAGYAGGQFEVFYPANVLTAIETVAGNLSLESSFLVQGNTSQAGSVKIIIAGATRAKRTEGVLAVIRFSVKDDAALDTFGLTFGGETKAFNENLQTMSIQTTPGRFTVVGTQPIPQYGIVLSKDMPRYRPGDSIKVVVTGLKLQGAVGVTVRLSYDPAKLEFEKFIANEAFFTPGEKINQNPPYVEIGVAILGETVQSSTTPIGTAVFQASPSFTTTSISSSFAELRRKGAEGFETIDPKVSLEIIEGCAEDFDGSGEIDFRDFFLLAENFGGNNPLFDLDKNGTIGLGDFILFTDSFVNGCD